MLYFLYQYEYTYNNCYYYYCYITELTIHGVSYFIILHQFDFLQKIKMHIAVSSLVWFFAKNQRSELTALCILIMSVLFFVCKKSNKWGDSTVHFNHVRAHFVQKNQTSELTALCILIMPVLIFCKKSNKWADSTVHFNYVRADFLQKIKQVSWQQCAF